MNENYLMYDLSNCIKEFPDEEHGDEFYINLLIEPLLEVIERSRILLNNYKIIHNNEVELLCNLSVLFNMKNLLSVVDVDINVDTNIELASSSYTEEEIHVILLEKLRNILITVIIMFDASSRVTLQDSKVSYVINERFTFETAS